MYRSTLLKWSTCYQCYHSGITKQSLQRNKTVVHRGTLQLENFSLVPLHRQTRRDGSRKLHQATRVAVINDSVAAENNERIPVTRRTLIRKLMEQENLLTPSEKVIFEQFLHSLDSAIYKSFRPQLLYLKKKYDSLNPDNGSMMTSSRRAKERKDDEYWLMHRLSTVMETACFRRLTQKEVLESLSEHDQDGIMVSVDPTQYETLAFWVLGRTKYSEPKIKVFRKMKDATMRKISGRPVRDKPDYYQRVVVAMRLRRDKYFHLKAFKDVPVDCLEQLLPNGTIVMTKWDKYLLWGSVGFGGVSLAIRGVAALEGQTYLNYSLVFAGIMGILIYRAVFHYLNKRNSYLLKISNMLYYKNIANNKGLIMLLVDRAEDEVFRKVLLAYVAILTNRPDFYVPGDLPSQVTERDESMPLSAGVPVDQLPPPSPMSHKDIEVKVTSWLQALTGRRRVKFEAASVLKLLTSLKIVEVSEAYASDAVYRALPLSQAITFLPTTEVVTERTEEFQLEEISGKESTPGLERQQFWVKPKNYREKLVDKGRAITMRKISEVQARTKNILKIDSDSRIVEGWGSRSFGISPLIKNKVQGGYRYLKQLHASNKKSGAG